MIDVEAQQLAQQRGPVLPVAQRIVAGAAVADPETGEIRIRKRKGRLAGLAEDLEASPLPGTVGVGHTRWATHGPPSELNSHPHADCTGDIALVHNG
ncbi:MAG: hypothetical protein U9O18_06985, partial [Chloroflexota bacterium]|nr:hypothetical protein [Chloroflexota bacterium]